VSVFLVVLAVLAVAIPAVLLLQADTKTPLSKRFAAFRLVGLDAGVVTLAQAKLNATDDIDVTVIDEFTKRSTEILGRLSFDDVVNAAGNGATLTYGYTRQSSQRAAAFRAINAEYTPTEVTKARFSVDLKPLGGSYQIDRVNARIAAGAEVAFQVRELVKASSAKFADAFFNGDTAGAGDLVNGFDGLSKLLTGTTTEYLPLSNGTALGYLDMSVIDTKAEALAFTEQVDNWLSLMDGLPDAIYGNRRVLSKFKYVAAWSDMIDRDSNDAFGRPVTRYNGIPLVDPGEIAGASTAILPLVSRDTDAGGAGGTITNLGDLYAVRFGLDGVHGVAMAGQPLVQQWLPDFTSAGAVKTGELEMGPVAVVVKATKSAAVLRNLKVA
jgi:hypothetical protein